MRLGAFFYPLTLVAIILVSSCAPREISGDYLQKGFDYTNLGYTSLPESSPLNETITIKNLRVIVVGSLDECRPVSITLNADDTAQPAEPRYVIWVVGKKLKGKIIINQVVLGYELKNLLHLIKPDVLCPCDLEAFEACIAMRPAEACGQQVQ